MSTALSQKTKNESPADDYKRRELFRNAEIPVRFKGKDFDSYLPTCEGGKKALRISKSFAGSFSDRLACGDGLIFFGKTGTGKTHLSCAIASYIIREFGYSVLFTEVLEMTRQIKETYRRDTAQTEREVMRKFCRPSLLILDEVGMQFGSDAEKVIVSDIINIRYKRVKSTILVSNLTLSELEACVGDRGVDRMYEGGGVIIPFDWGSYRRGS